MKDMDQNPENTKPPLPVEEDVMQLARLGEIGALQKLFDSGKYDATYMDEQGITALHVRLRTRNSQERNGHEEDDEAESAQRLTCYFIVGCDQQSLRVMSLPHHFWRTHKCKGR